MRDILQFFGGILILAGTSVLFGSQTREQVIVRYPSGNPWKVYTVDSDGNADGEYWEFREDGSPSQYVDWYHGQIGWGQILYDVNGDEVERRL